MGTEVKTLIFKGITVRFGNTVELVWRAIRCPVRNYACGGILDYVHGTWWKCRECGHWASKS